MDKFVLRLKVHGKAEVQVPVLKAQLVFISMTHKDLEVYGFGPFLAGLVRVVRRLNVESYL